MLLKNCASAFDKKERLRPLNKAAGNASRNKLVKASGLPVRIKSLGKVYSSKDSPKAWPGFVKHILNGLRKKQNLSRVDRPGWKPAWQGERMELRSRKKSRRNRMMHSKSFESKEVREVGWREPGECRGFSMLWMGINLR